MTKNRLSLIKRRAKELVKDNSPEERTLLAEYILELIEDRKSLYQLAYRAGVVNGFDQRDKD